MTPVKGFDLAVEAARVLFQQGKIFKWYFVGGGVDRQRIEQLIIDNNLSEVIEITGLQDNPYPYIKKCDIYVQPSRHEGFCITLAEALCFGNPIVATDFTGAKEQLKERENGFVVAMSAETIASGIEKALSVSKTAKVREDKNLDVRRLLSLLD